MRRAIPRPSDSSRPDAAWGSTCTAPPAAEFTEAAEMRGSNMLDGRPRSVLHDETTVERLR